MRESGVLIAVLCFFSALGQQKTGFDPADPKLQFTFDQWTGDNGLISNNLTSVIQTRSGFLWITTYNGLMKYDGHTLEVFDRTTHPFFKTDAFYRAYEDKEGIVWLASQGSGIVQIRGDSIVPFLSTNKILPQSIRTLCFDYKSETVWAGSNNRGVYSIRDTIVLQLAHPKLNEVTVLSLFADSHGVLWIATDGNGLFTYDGNKFHEYTTANGLASNNVNVVRVLEDGTVLAGTAWGLSVGKSGKFESLKSLQNVPVNYMQVDDFENIWMGTEKGLARLHLKRNRYDFWADEQEVPLTRVNSIAFDREGSMWLGTGRSGMIRIKRSVLRNFNKGNGLSYDIVNSITERNGKFYVGTDAGTVDIFGEGKVERLKIDTDLKNAGVRDITFDQEGNLWLASYAGVLRKTSRGEKLLTTADGLPANDFRRIWIDSKNNLWLASRSGGVVKFKDDKVQEAFNRTNHLSSNYVLALEESTKGDLYFGTHSGGLTVLYSSGRTETFHIGKDDSGVLIFNIHLDSRDRVWIVTNVGLFFFDGSKFIPLVLDGVSKGETYFDWVEDDLGNVWTTTNIGILQLAKDHILQFLEAKLKSIPGRMYDDTDGMYNKECTGATRSIISSSGEIWVPTIKGVTVLEPASIRKNELKPPVYVTHFIADNKELSGSTIEVPAGTVRNIIRFTALSLVAPSKVKLKYQLRGVDKEWVDAGRARVAEYTNLPPGDYLFSVIASNNDGVWNDKGAMLKFTVMPFFYQTTAFYILLAVVAASVIYAIFKLRLRSIEKRNRELRKVNSELDRFVYSASHDLRAPLTSILGLVNVFRLDHSEQNRELYLRQIENSVLKLDEFIHDIIDFSRNARTDVHSEPVSFGYVINETLDELRYLDKENRIEKRVNVSGDGDFWTDRKRLKIVLNNLVSNAIHYHNLVQPSPFIEVAVRYTSGEAQLSVKDNGKGISPLHQDNIFKMFYRANEESKGSGLGLYIVKETLAKLNGTINVQSTQYEGSCFEIRIPSLNHRK